MKLSYFPLLILALPLAEIAMFIVVGSQIGVLATLGLIFLTMLVGSVLLRVQGFGLLRRISAETAAGRVPSRELVHGVMIVVAGMLLIIPGFITDLLGLLLFIPPVRDFGWKLLRNRITVVASGMGGRSPFRRGEPNPNDGYTQTREPVIDLDEDDFQRDPSPDSPWRDPAIDRPDKPRR